MKTIPKMVIKNSLQVFSDQFFMCQNFNWKTNIVIL